MKKTTVLSLILLGLCSGAFALETAGTLAVDLDVGDLSASEGAKITTWNNDGALGGVFTNETADQGAIYRTNILGAAAVEFTGNVNTVMKGTAGVPTSLTSNNSFTVEVWIYNPAEGSTPENFVSWTPRGDSDDADTVVSYELMELRWYNSANTLEHYGYNVNWSVRGRPSTTTWHHLVYTRDKATNIERVYNDGKLYAEATLSGTRIRPDGIFVLGGTQNGAKTGFEYFFSGCLGKVRIHTGTLSQAQVVQNYMEERDEYGTTDSPDPVWTGTAGVPLDWADSANWAGGAIPENDNYVNIKNGGVPVYTNVSSLTLEEIIAENGGLIVSNNATLYINDTRNVADWDQFGSGTGNEFLLAVTSGKLEFTGSATHTVRLGYTGASSIAEIGGDGTAELVIDNDFHVGYSASGTLASTGIVNIATSGSVETLNGASGIDIGLYQNAYGEVNVNGGRLGGADTANITLTYSGGHGKLTLNSGTVETPGDVRVSYGASSAYADARLILNGGELEARRIYVVNQSGLQQIWLNGGTIRNTDTRTDFFSGFDTAWMQSGGVSFDIIAGTQVTAVQPLIEDSGSAGGGLTKNGEGVLVLNGTNTFTGDITVNEGLLLLNNSEGLVAGYSGNIILDNPDAGIGFDKAGGVDELLALLDTNSVGQIIVMTANAADDIDFSSYPYLTLAFSEGVDYNGTYTPFGSTYTLNPVGSGNLFSQALTGSVNVEICGTENDEIELTGDSSYDGGTLIDGCDLILSHTNGLGAGGITLTNGAVLKLNVSGLDDDFAQRITTGSKGFIMLTTASAGVNLNLAGLPGIQVGTELANLTHTGDIIPADNTYRFTGGGQRMRTYSSLGLQVSNLGGANTVEVQNGNDERVFIDETYGYTGGITLGAGNTYTGGTVITNKGLVRADGDYFGAVPSSFDADNIYVNDGCFRLGQYDITFNENRGLTVGPDGMELHPWGSHTFKIMGSLSGSGEISSTDSGTVFFGGTNNTWGGTLDLDVGTMGVGEGNNFSWNNAALIVGAGGYFAVNYDGVLTWSSEFDKPLGTDGPDLIFRKMGSGTLSVDVNPVYTGNTQVENGTLQVASASAIPHGTGKGDLVLSSGASVDVNGNDISVNGLSGSGNIKDDDGAASTVSAGEDGSSSTFTGSIEPELELVKTGSGTLTLGDGVEVKDATISAGVLELVNPNAPTGAVSIADDATLLINGDSSDLVGYFYNYTLADQSVLNTLSGVNNLFAGRTAAVISPLTDTTSVFDFGATVLGPSAFPAPYNNAAQNNFIAKWEGRFLAETSGDYTFSIKSDDGSSLFIDDQVVLANGYNQSYGDRNPSAVVTLSAGYHDFLVAFSDNTGDQGLVVNVTVPGGTATPIPASLLAGGEPSVITSISSGTDGLLEIDDAAALVLNVDSDTTFEGRIAAGTGASAVLIKDGSGTLSLNSNGHDIEGMTSVKEGTLYIESDGTDSYGRMHVESGAELSIKVLGEGTAPASLEGAGLLGYYYDYTVAQPNPYTALDNGVLSSVEAYLSAQTPALIENSTTSSTNFYFCYGSNQGIADISYDGKFPALFEGTEYFDVIWYGQILIPADGTYDFRTNSDDGSMVYIDGVLVVNNGGRHGATYKTGTATLTAGPHDIVVTFYEIGGGDFICMDYKLSAATTWLKMPQSMLRPYMFEIGALSGSGLLTVDALSGGLMINQELDTSFSGNVAATNTAVIFKGGPSTLTLTSDNSEFYGSWSVLEGTLQVGDGVSSCDLGGSNVYVRSGAVLLFNCPGDVVYSGSVSGDGVIRSIGGGRVIFTGDVSGFIGVMDINAAGVVEVSAATGMSMSVITNAGVLIIGENASLIDTEIAGDGTTIVAENGILDIGSRTIPNTIELDGGVLVASATNALASLTVSTNGTSSLLLDVTAEGQEFAASNLILEAGSTLKVHPYGGLLSRYYDYGSYPGTDAFVSILNYTNWVATKTLTIETNTAYNSLGLDYGSTGAYFPGKYDVDTGDQNYFTSLYMGGIIISRTGEYNFRTASDDNSMLFIDGVLVVDNNGGHSYSSKEGSVTLTNGVHDFCMFFAEQTGGQGLAAYITIPGESEKVIPNSMLIPLEDDVLIPYTVAADSVSVINPPGAGTVDMTSDGTLTLPALTVEYGANLAVDGAVAVDELDLSVTIDQEIPMGSTLVGDFTGTADGLILDGVTTTLTGSEAELYYSNKKLYIRNSGGTLIILR